MELIEDIKSDTISSAYVEGIFIEALKVLKANDYRLISLEDNAGLRIQQGTDAFVSKNGNWVREGALFVQKKGVFITKDSPVSENPERAVKANMGGEDFFVTDSQVQKTLETSIQVPYDSFEIPTNRFGDNEITRFCFGEHAEKYGLFLENSGISKMLLKFSSKNSIEEKRGSFARQLWFCGLKRDSTLYGNVRPLLFYVMSRGIKEIV